MSIESRFRILQGRVSFTGFADQTVLARLEALRLLWCTRFVHVLVESEAPHLPWHTYSVYVFAGSEVPLLPWHTHFVHIACTHTTCAHMRRLHKHHALGFLHDGKEPMRTC